MKQVLESFSLKVCKKRGWPGIWLGLFRNSKFCGLCKGLIKVSVFIGRDIGQVLSQEFLPPMLVQLVVSVPIYST